MKKINSSEAMAYILGTLSIALSILFIVNDIKSVSAIITGIIDLAITLIAMIYFIKGSGKSENRYYKLYFLLNAAAYIISYLIAIIAGDYMAESDFVISLFLGMICYGNYLCIAFAKDLGKKVSIVMILINIIIYTLYSSSLLITSIVKKNFDSMVFFQYFSYLPSCAIDYIIVRAKYQDKQHRHTV